MFKDLKTLALPLIIVLMVLLLTQDSALAGQGPNDIIRFHVIANSDRTMDQAVKLRVRDKLLNEFEDLFSNSVSVSQSRNIIRDNLNGIEKIAQDEVNKYSKGYKVRAILGDFPFPTKAYGNMVFPAGNYEALRVTIGSGEGANWWCVMFPPLCFVDISHGTIEDGVDETLEESVDDIGAEYDDMPEEIQENEKEDKQETNETTKVNVKYRFKVLELLEEIIGKF